MAASIEFNIIDTTRYDEDGLAQRLTQVADAGFSFAYIVDKFVVYSRTAVKPVAKRAG